MRSRAENPVLECSTFRRALDGLRARLPARPGRDAEAFLERAALESDSLPRGIRIALHRFRLRGNRDGYLLLHGLPFAPGRGAEAFLALIGSRLGELVGYLQEKNGALFHDVIPEKSQEREQSAAGSRVPLELHTERCFHPYLPSYVLLACLREDRNGEALTEIASVRKLLPLVPARHVPILFEPAFRTGVDYSFGNVRTRKGNGPVMSILYGDRHDPCLRYDLDLMVGLSARAGAALDAVRDAALRARDSIGLKAGDLIAIDNRRAVHGRSAFRPRYDGRDRWLKRAYLVPELPALACLPGERVIRTRFGRNTRASRPAPK
jgi:L-asparagine oxygenase